MYTSTSSPIAQLYEQYASNILLYAYQHTSSYQDAEDIVVTVFLAAIEDKRFLTMNENEQLSWLRRVAHNKLVDSHRYAKSHSQLSLTAGHDFDTSPNGPFASYLTNSVIGNSGTTLWLSVLLRKETNDDQQTWVSLNNEQVDWCATCTTQEVNVGYFGSGSDAQGTRYWSLQLGGAVYRTSVPVVIGQTALLVLSVNFGTATQCQLYVDPNSLGGPAPDASNAQASIATNLLMHNLDYYGGDTSGNSSLAAIRIGTSYAAITPGT